MPLRKLVSSSKTIPDQIQWSNPESGDGYIRFYTPLMVDGILEAGLVLTGGTYARIPDRHVTFELSVIGHNAKRLTKLIRVDWRDLRGGHSNQRRNCDKGTRVKESHIHPFELNFVPAGARMKKGNLPCAEDIAEDLQTYEALRSYVGRVFRINNIDIVPRPDWVYDLFYEAG